MIIDYGKPEGSRLIFVEDFKNRQVIQSRNGIIANATIAAYAGGSISPTSLYSQVKFMGTQSLGVFFTKMTISMRFITSSTNLAYSPYLLVKNPSAINDNQFYISLYGPNTGGGYFYFEVAASASDNANYQMANSQFSLGAEYLTHIVYDGSLAASSRVCFYANGIMLASAMTGTIPAYMRSSASKLSLFNPDGFNGAPPNDFIVKSVKIYNNAFTAQEVLDDYNQNTYSKIFGGG